MKASKAKSTNSREITDYFLKMAHKASNNSNIPTPDKEAIEELDKEYL